MQRCAKQSMARYDRGVQAQAPPVPTSSTLRHATRLRRSYFDVRFGQLHLHNAIPAGGGFDELTPLLCVHDAAQTGRAWADVLAQLGADRSVYAPDLPGCGESDAAPGLGFADATAVALGDFIDDLRLRRFDLLAVGQGVQAAALLAAARGASVHRFVALDPPAAVQPAPGLVLSGAQAAAHSRCAALRRFLVP